MSFTFMGVFELVVLLVFFTYGLFMFHIARTT